MEGKDIILLRKDFYTNLADLVNNSGLPAFVMADILRDALAQVSQIAVKQEEEAINTIKECKKENTNGSSEDE